MSAREDMEAWLDGWGITSNDPERGRLLDAFDVEAEATQEAMLAAVQEAHRDAAEPPALESQYAKDARLWRKRIDSSEPEDVAAEMKALHDHEAAAFKAGYEQALAELDVELADALVETFRELATEHWPFLRGDGWPAYSEQGQSEQVMVVTELAERLYARLAREGSE